MTKEWIKRIFIKKKKCILCNHYIPIGEEWSEIELSSPTTGTAMYFHNYCWQRYNEKIKWHQKTGTVAEAEELAYK